MTEDPHLSALHAAVNCYLSTLLAAGNCLADACPEIGGMYRHRLGRLRTRLAFDSSPEALQESSSAVEAEMKEYAEKTSDYVRHHAIEVRSAIAALEEIVRSFAQRQDFYSARLRQFAAQMETADLQEAVSSCIESMNHETQSQMAGMRNELAAVESRLRDAEVTDPLTGLMNRRELERRIEAQKGSGAVPILLHFELGGEINDDVAKQIAVRLASQFRHKDFVCRWTATEFMVLFQGPIEIARSRTEQIVPWIAGRYLLDSGESVEVDVNVKLLEPEPVA